MLERMWRRYNHSCVAGGDTEWHSQSRKELGSFFSLKKKILILEREKREKHRFVVLLMCGFIGRFLHAPWWGSCNLGIPGQRSNQVSRLARASRFWTKHTETPLLGIFPTEKYKLRFTQKHVHDRPQQPICNSEKLEWAQASSDRGMAKH